MVGRKEFGICVWGCYLNVNVELWNVDHDLNQSSVELVCLRQDGFSTTIHYTFIWLKVKHSELNTSNVLGIFIFQYVFTQTNHLLQTLYRILITVDLFLHTVIPLIIYTEVFKVNVRTNNW